MPNQKKKYTHEALVELFGEYHGWDSSRLDRWQSLCQRCDLTPQPSIKKCKQSLRSVNINIIDLIEACKSGEIPRRFSSKRQLAADLKQHPSRRFPLSLAQDNGFLRALLVELR